MTGSGSASRRSRQPLVALAFVIALAAAVVVLVAQTSTRVRVGAYPGMESYRVVDARTLALTVAVAPRSWTRVTSVAETATEVRITVESLDIELGAGSSELLLVELPVSLSRDLEGRAVLDDAGGVVPRG